MPGLVPAPWFTRQGDADVSPFRRVVKTAPSENRRASLIARTEINRGSQQYERWHKLLHHFYDLFPVVEHYEAVVRHPCRWP